jgi:hypothetical protein
MMTTNKENRNSIEWLIDQVEDIMGLIPYDICEKAKQIHKEEIIIAFGCDRFPCSVEDCENYYNETFNQTNNDNE